MFYPSRGDCAFGVMVLAVSLLGAGCQSQPLVPPDSQIPRELSKISMPAYVIEPPDILLVDVIRVIPQPPYKIAPRDVLYIEIRDLPDIPPIAANIPVESDGTINLGPDLGMIRVVGLTVAKAKEQIEDVIRQKMIKTFKVTVLPIQSGALQQIRGEHLVRPDGIISLGSYGSVYVTGMTVPEARQAIEDHLSRFLLTPEISLDILAYNSKVYYVITDGGGFGQQVVRMPITGNETVLDAISNINGLPSQSSKKIWIARPAPPGSCDEPHDQILPVDWRGIVQCGQTATNYQVLPGDRVYVKADFLLTFDNWLGKITNPMERLFGVAILGNATVRDLAGSRSGAGTGTGGTGGF
jgi:polysaccharide export outer membrane protein